MKQTKTGQQVESICCGQPFVPLPSASRQQHPLSWTNPLPKTPAALVQLAFDLTQNWLSDYEARNLDAVDLIFNVYQGVGRYAPTITRLIPPTSFWQNNTASNQPDSLLIIETDPLNLFVHIITQWITFALYARLLESAAAEHSTRYQLMEAATQNAKCLIDELTISIQTARRQAITEEMQTLVAGAGLVGSS